MYGIRNKGNEKSKLVYTCMWIYERARWDGEEKVFVLKYERKR